MILNIENYKGFSLIETLVAIFITAIVSSTFLSMGTTIILGILTTYSYEQALERSDPNKKNKGAEIILAAFNSVENFKNI